MLYKKIDNLHLRAAVYIQRAAHEVSVGTHGPGINNYADKADALLKEAEQEIEKIGATPVALPPNWWLGDDNK